MIGHPHVARFKTLPSRAGAIDPHVLDDVRSQVLWVLGVTKEDPELDYLTPAQIADVLCDAEGIQASRQQVAAILKKEKQTVARRRWGSRDRYKIMKAGQDALSSGQPFAATLINPANALSEIRKVEELLSALRGDLRVCDPYVDKKTLDLLAECSSASSVQLLTVNVQKESSFRRDMDAFARQHGVPLEVRQAANAKLHDRFIIHDVGMLLLGGSLNGLGKKQSFIVELGEGMRSVVATEFEKEWRTASKFA